MWMLIFYVEKMVLFAIFLTVLKNPGYNKSVNRFGDQKFYKRGLI